MTETTAEQRDQARRLVETVTIFPGLVELLAPLLADAERLAEIEAGLKDVVVRLLVRANGVEKELRTLRSIEAQNDADCIQRILNGGGSDA